MSVETARLDEFDGPALRRLALDASAALVAQKGGTIMVPPFDIAGVGRMAVISDPQGAVLALVTSAMGD